MLISTTRKSLYLCIYVVIRRPHAHYLIAHAHNYCGEDRLFWLRVIKL